MTAGSSHYTLNLPLAATLLPGRLVTVSVLTARGALSQG